MKTFEPVHNATILESIESYIEHGASLGRLRRTTIRNRWFELNRFASFCASKEIDSPRRIHRNLVVAYLGSVKAGNGSKYTILAILSSFMTYLVDEGLAPENFIAEMKRPKAYRAEADFLTEEEIDALFQSAAENSWESQLDRNLLLLSLLTSLCLRVSEALSLRLEDVSLRPPCVWVSRKGGKVEKLPLNEDLVEKFEIWFEERSRWKGHESPWVFLSTRGRRMSVRRVQRMIAEFLTKAGIVKRSMGAHLIRHSGATCYLRNGTDIKTVQVLLGHENLSTTSRYVHSNAKALESAVARFRSDTSRNDPPVS